MLLPHRVKERLAYNACAYDNERARTFHDQVEAWEILGWTKCPEVVMLALDSSVVACEFASTLRVRIETICMSFQGLFVMCSRSGHVQPFVSPPIDGLSQDIQWTRSAAWARRSSARPRPDWYSKVKASGAPNSWEMCTLYAGSARLSVLLSRCGRGLR